MKRVTVFAIAAFVLSSIGGYAQNQPQTQVQQADNVWSLQECIQYGLENNLAIKRSELLLRSSEVGLLQAKARFLPTLTGSAQHQANFGRYVDPTTNAFISDKSQTSNIGVNGSLLLFQGGAQINNLRQNQTAVKAGQEDLKQSRYTTSLNVAVNYLTVLQNQELVVVAKNQADVSRFQAERTERLVAAGSLPQTDLLNLQAQFANDRAALTTAENDLRIARLTLMQSMNLPAQDNFNIEQINLEDPTINAYEKNAAQVYEAALQTLHSVKSADLLVQSNNYAVSAARGLLYPRLSLTAGMNSFYSSGQRFRTRTQVSDQTIIGFVNGDQNIPVIVNEPSYRVTESKYSFSNQLWDNLGQYIGLNLSVPIINGWQTRTQISRAIVDRNISELDAQTVRVQIRQDIELAYNNMEAAASQYLANKQQVESLALAFRAAETRFNVGAINSTDYNVAKANLNLAQANLILAKYNYYFRLKVLDFYQNKPLTF